MRRVSSNVRRCLFPNCQTDQSTTDNLTNIIRESIEIESEEKSKKYNFDFKHDRPLDGKFHWFEGDGVRNDWIGVKIEDEDNAITDELTNDHEETEVQNEKSDEMLPQSVNETTPRSIKEDSVPPPAKKRMNEVDERNSSRVKRRILDQLQ